MRWIHSNHIRSTLLNYFCLKSPFCSKDIEIHRDTGIECRVELHSESNGTSLTSLQGGSGRSRSGKLPWSNWSECAVWAAWALQHLDAFWMHFGQVAPTPTWTTRTTSVLESKMQFRWVLSLYPNAFETAFKRPRSWAPCHAWCIERPSSFKWKKSKWSCDMWGQDSKHWDEFIEGHERNSK